MNTHCAHRSSERGVILLTALVSVVIVGAMVAAMLGTVQAEKQHSTSYRKESRVMLLAEAATVSAERQIIRAVANTLPVPASGTVNLGPHLATFTVEQIGADSIETDADGIQTIHRHFVVAATATDQGFTKRVNRVLDVGMTPIFQFAIFYDKTLELLPGPSMTLSGRVHCNDDIYAGVGGSSTLTIDSDYFRSVGHIYRRRLNNGSATGGTVRLRKLGSNSYYDLFSQSQLNALGVPSISGFDSDFTGFDANGDGDLSDPGDWEDFAVSSLSIWNGTLQTGDHGMNRIEPPEIGSIKRFESVAAGQGDYVWDAATSTYVDVGAGNGDHRKGRYHDNADLIIRDNVAYDNAGNVLPIPAGVITETLMYEGREQQNIRVTEIDLGALATAGFFPGNGLIYASRSDSGQATPNGIRLTNGDALGGPLTVATENPMYVHGDYNTVNKQPAAVIADAVNLLSNAWDDTKQPGTLPNALETTFNVAMITGGPETAGSQYSGGFENLPRFHEKWSGVNCNIRGSFVKIYAAEIAQGDWVYGSDRYTAPRRNWDYDQSLNDAANLPPFTPNVAQVKSEGWWE